VGAGRAAYGPAVKAGPLPCADRIAAPAPRRARRLDYKRGRFGSKNGSSGFEGCRPIDPPLNERAARSRRYNPNLWILAARRSSEVDLYQRTATPLLRLSPKRAPGDAPDPEPDPDPWTILTRAIETTDEAGSLVLLKCVAL